MILSPSVMNLPYLKHLTQTSNFPTNLQCIHINVFNNRLKENRGFAALILVWGRFCGILLSIQNLSHQNNAPTRQTHSCTTTETFFFGSHSYTSPTFSTNTITWAAAATTTRTTRRISGGSLVPNRAIPNTRRRRSCATPENGASYNATNSSPSQPPPRRITLAIATTMLKIHRARLSLRSKIRL